MEYQDFSARINQLAYDRERVTKAQMEITYKCNLRCVHCYTDCYNDPRFFSKEMPLSEIKRILDEMADYGILWLNLTGGEIFFRKDFFEIYEYACRKGFIIVLYTNGTVFTEKIIDRLRQNPPFFIDISCHSVNEQAFDRFTQVSGSFLKFMEGIGLIQKSGLPFRIKTKAMTWNRNEIPAIQEFVESLHLEFGFTTFLTPRLNGDLAPLAYRLPPEEINELEVAQGDTFETEEDCRNARAMIGTPAQNLYRCNCATNSIHINAWAELGTCTFEYESRASLRDYSLKDAIQKTFTEVRAMQYEGKSPCRDCQIYAFCEKTPSAARLQTGNAEEAVPYLCDVAYLHVKKVSSITVSHPLTHK